MLALVFLWRHDFTHRFVVVVVVVVVVGCICNGAWIHVSVAFFCCCLRYGCISMFIWLLGVHNVSVVVDDRSC